MNRVARIVLSVSAASFVFFPAACDRSDSKAEVRWVYRPTAFERAATHSTIRHRVPTTLSEFSCFAINIRASDIAPIADLPSGVFSSCLSLGTTSQTVGWNELITRGVSIYAAKGAKRTVEVIGFKSIAPCAGKPFRDVLKSPGTEMYEIGRAKSVDFTSDVVLRIPNSYQSQTASDRLAYCRFQSGAAEPFGLAGVWDTSFDPAENETYMATFTSERCNAASVYGEGAGQRILLAGYRKAAVAYSSLKRLTANGVLDTAFGGSGDITIGSSGDVGRLEAVNVVGNTAIVTGAQRPNAYWAPVAAAVALEGLSAVIPSALNVFLSDVPPPPNSAPSVLYPDGSVRVAATTFSPNQLFAVGGWTAQLAPASIGGVGLIVDSTLGPGDTKYVSAIARQPDGKLLVGATNEFSGTPSYPQAVLIRYSAQGVPDGTFGSSGEHFRRIYQSVGNYSEVRKILIDTLDAVNPRAIIVGSAQMTDELPGSYVGAILLDSGLPDSTFGQSGYAKIPSTDHPNAQNTASAAWLQPDGKIIIGGNSGSALNPRLFLARLNRNGKLDTTFGTNGFLLIDVDPGPGETEFPRDIVSFGADRILIAGNLTTETCFVMVVK